MVKPLFIFLTNVKWSRKKLLYIEIKFTISTAKNISSFFMVQPKTYKAIWTNKQPKKKNYLGLHMRKNYFEKDSKDLLD